LILGDRGIGKTRWVKEIAKEKLKKKVVYANCASFADDTMAESELFGHKQGAFTGAIKDNEGLFKEAANQILFFDEVHNLSLRVQEKLMTALQTESAGENKGKFCIRRLGDSKEVHVELRPVFASNLKISELKKKIMPDLYDRISQLVIEFPSIRESKLDLQTEFKKVWIEMDFKEFPIAPHSKEFIDWLKRISLEGNYRTLQSVAINWHQGRLIEYTKKEVKFPEKESEVFDFVRKQFSKFHAGTSTITKNTVYNFRIGISKKQMKKEYEKALYDWAISKNGYGSATEAQKGLEHVRLSNPHKK
jgi:transcriptional regulator with AAA-type ATPase domain